MLGRAHLLSKMQVEMALGRHLLTHVSILRGKTKTAVTVGHREWLSYGRLCHWRNVNTSNLDATLRVPRSARNTGWVQLSRTWRPGTDIGEE